MNAYELADEIDSIAKDWLGQEKSGKLANMLRQQANELDKVVPQLVKANGLIENLRLRIAELEKGEEVAGRFYWESVVDGHVMAVPSEGTPHYNKDDFPLYTTPQIKRLSDEEITMIGLKHLECVDDCYIQRFARAIEERHGIK